MPVLLDQGGTWRRPSHGTVPATVLAATLFAHGPAAFDVDIPAGLGGDLLLWRRSGWGGAGGVPPAEQARGRRGGLRPQRGEAGLLVGGTPGLGAGGGASPVGPGPLPLL